MCMKMSKLLQLLLLLLLLLILSVELTSARCNQRDATLATFNAGLVDGRFGAVDARVTVMIDQVRIRSWSDPVLTTSLPDDKK